MLSIALASSKSGISLGGTVSVDVVPFPVITISSWIEVIVGTGMLRFIGDNDVVLVATFPVESKGTSIPVVNPLTTEPNLLGSVCVSKQSRSKSGEATPPAADGQATGNGMKLARALS